MDRHGSPTTSATPSLKRKWEPEFQAQNRARQMPAVPPPSSERPQPLSCIDLLPSSSPSITLKSIDRHGGPKTSARPSLKRKLESEFQAQNWASQIPVVKVSKKEGTLLAVLTHQIDMVRRIAAELLVHDKTEEFILPSEQSDSTTTSTSFPIPHWDYDVFLSFRGEETRENFTGHLYSALVRDGIRTFRDDELRRGTIISTGLVHTIRRSRISIVIFSKGYASSRWCLDELVEIVNCRNTIGQTLLPIFYHVDPSDVRGQTRTFAEAFAEHEELFQTEMEMVQRWRLALTEAANSSGWVYSSSAYGDESSFIGQIVAYVSREVEPRGLHVARHPVGTSSRARQVLHLLNLGLNDVHTVGIYGMGGIGKTTIAKAVYNEICYGFEGSSCLLNIKENSDLNNLVHLQEQLLLEILKTKIWKIDSVDRGINLIEKRIYGKRVFIVLDDVDDMKQFYALVGDLKWLGPASRIIVTTRDENMLTKLDVHKKYKVEELGKNESLQLFKLNAFSMGHLKGDYAKLSIDAVKYCEGLPLALEVLGSSLLGRSLVEWERELEKLQIIPHKKIQDILQISFESLDDNTKDIFLDIVCFFVGEDREYVAKVLDGCGFLPDIGINVLIQRSLLTIDNDNKLKMHGLIQDMGREIERKKSPKYPGKRSRLWFQKDALNVLNKNTGSKTVEGLALNLTVPGEVNLKTKAFEKMKNLRLLEINAVRLTGSYNYLPRELRWLRWHNCSLKSLPENFHLNELVILDMQYSDVEEVWKKGKVLNKLTVLNLSNSKSLTKLPIFSQITTLETLVLKGCISLVWIHESIGNLKRLLLLDLEGCKNLKNLPTSISNLKSLEMLNLSGCSKLDSLPEEIGDMMALKHLLASGTAIKQLPSSFVRLKKLKTVLFSWLQFSLSWISSQSFNRLLPACIYVFRSLTTLHLPECNLTEDGIPVTFGSIPSLQNLDLSRNNLCSLPHCISYLPQLYFLSVRECMALRSISGLPASVGVVDASGCTSVERLKILPNRRSSQVFILRNCPKLIKIQGLESLEFTSIIHTRGCKDLASDFRSQLQCLSTMCDDQYRVICLPGSEIPNWFRFQGIGPSISFHVPPISKNENLQFLVCAVYAANEAYSKVGGHDFYVIIHNKTRSCKHILAATLVPGILNFEGYVFLYQTPLIRNGLVMKRGEEIEVSIKLWKMPNAKKCGIHPIVD